MKNGFFDKFPCEIIEGKGLLIAIVIVFSSLSFTLGFFIGKKVQTPDFLSTSFNTALKESEIVEEEVSQTGVVEKKVIVPVAEENEEVKANKENKESNGVIDKAAINNNVSHNDLKTVIAEPKKVDTKKDVQGKDSTKEPAKTAKKDKEEDKLKRDVDKNESADAKITDIKSNDAKGLQKDLQKKDAKKMAAANNSTVKDASVALKAEAVNKAKLDEANKLKSEDINKVKVNTAANKIRIEEANKAKLEEVRQSITESSTATTNTAADVKGGQKYFVQAGAFKSKEQADILKGKLEGQGFQATVYKQTIKDQLIMYKVRIGDFETKEEADLALSKLNKKGVTGFVKSFVKGAAR
ncbi:MAG: SPOR domain-containing protein [Candidatus Magnetoovum sp. WYHC-5]|nr:SPOR domain-containing protein [Candidatus Magnetoovum sp. WYHC-5]